MFSLSCYDLACGIHVLTCILDKMLGYRCFFRPNVSCACFPESQFISVLSCATNCNPYGFQPWIMNNILIAVIWLQLQDIQRTKETGKWTWDFLLEQICYFFLYRIYLLKKSMISLNTSSFLDIKTNHSVYNQHRQIWLLYLFLK